MIVGLTGGIGSGKSVAGDFFIELGIDVIDADHVSKNILNDNESAKKLFLEQFGKKFIDKNEVEDIFEVPVSFLLDQRHHKIHYVERKGFKQPVYFIPWQDKLIWGATAAILRNLSHVIRTS